MLPPKVNPANVLRSTITPTVADRLLFASLGAAAALLITALLSSLTTTTTTTTTTTNQTQNYHILTNKTTNATLQDPSIDHPITNWDSQRQQHQLHHRPLPPNKVIMVTGAQHQPCHHPLGDHLLLRFFKNKADYCRIQNLKLYFSTATLHPKMRGCWAKIPAIRAVMIAHPEAEWVWWIDSDAAVTDMSFFPPFEEYLPYQLIVPGWPYMVYEDRNWVGLNAGVFILRNSQWGLDFLAAWAEMGPQSPEHEEWGRVLAREIKGKTTTDADDQAALVHLLVRNKERWSGRVHIENRYDLHGYWEMVMKNLTTVVGNGPSESSTAGLWRRWPKGMRRPFVTHFTGCQPCSGWHNPAYSWEGCVEAMRKALNFGDDQVLREYGFGRIGFNERDGVGSLWS